MLNNPAFAVQLGDSNHIMNVPDNFTGLHCYFWAASLTLLNRLGQSAMQQVIDTVFGSVVHAMADAIENLPDRPVEDINLLADTVFDVEIAGVERTIHAVISTHYRTANPPGLTHFIAILREDEVDAYVTERLEILQAMNPPDAGSSPTLH
jgi:hypothetical protein